MVHSSSAGISRSGIYQEGSSEQIQFDYFFTECYWDSLIAYDGPTNTYNVLAKLCGNRDAEQGYADTIVSTGKSMTLVFQSDSDAVAPGFRAKFTEIRMTLYKITLNHQPFNPQVEESRGLERENTTQQLLIRSWM